MSSHTPDDVKFDLDTKHAALLSGDTSFTKVTIGNSTTTAAALTAITGISSLGASAPMTYNLVAGASTSLTTAGFIRIHVADGGGNVTEGDYYIPYGTLA